LVAGVFPQAAKAVAHQSCSFFRKLQKPWPFKTDLALPALQWVNREWQCEKRDHSPSQQQRFLLWKSGKSPLFSVFSIAFTVSWSFGFGSRTAAFVNGFTALPTAKPEFPQI